MRLTFEPGRIIASLLVAGTFLTFLTGTPSVAAQWQIQTIDGGGPGRFSSLKVDKDGNVHVAYVIQDENFYPLRYAFWDHRIKHWFVMNVAQYASFCSLALDSKQRPHISWADQGGGKLRYSHWDGSTWQTQALPLNSEHIAYFTSIALDNDRPSISFYEYRGPKDSDLKIRLRIVMWNGKYWELRTIDSQEGSGKFNALATDTQGHLHLAYANVSADQAGMRYAYWDGNSWMQELVEDIHQNNHYVGQSANIAVDKDGKPHLCYMDSSVFLVKYAVRKGGRWEIQVVDQILRHGYPDRNSIALDDNGVPFVSYYDSGRGVLKVAQQVRGRWVSEIVDKNSSGFTSSLQFDHGTLWVSYSDELNGALKVANAAVGSESTDSAAMGNVKENSSGEPKR
jgi:hypothetical protein